MVNRHRRESPGAWHHVMNRGVARRTVIEGRRDANEFLECLLLVIQQGLLEVHAYCLMATHYHLLVRSPRGELSRAMMLAQNRYARWFNRGRRRDGPLWRARFFSKDVRTTAYRDVLVRYIDHNPVLAGMVSDPEEYGLGSAWHYHRTRNGPPWLYRGATEERVRARTGKAMYEPADYRAVFGGGVSKSVQWMIERHGFSRHGVEDAFADLVGAAPDKVKEWMRRKAELADGTQVGTGVLAPDPLLAAIADQELADPDWWIKPHRHRKPGWRALSCALLHSACACPIEDIAARLGLGSSTVGRHVKDHSSVVLRDAEYARRASDILSRVLQAELPPLD